MGISRRNFFRSGTASLAASSWLLSIKQLEARVVDPEIYDRLDKVLKAPVLRTESFPDPVVIESIDLLKYQESYLCRVRSRDGAEGWSVSNNIRMYFLYPIFQLRVKPIFIGRDARELESLLQEVYLHDSNYKFQSYALWIPVATLEFAILDMLGSIAGKPLGTLFGDRRRDHVSVYFAPNFRDKPAEESLRIAKEIGEEKGYRAMKFKIGKKMGADKEDVPGRTEKIIPLARKILGDDMWLGVDVNGGFGIERAIKIGRLLEENRYSFYEEPLPFDWYEETKYVADQLEIPIAGGEQEASMHNFRWLIANQGLQIVRPDMFYFGGMLRSMKVALMADVMQLKVVPHISGSGLGFLYALHFLSAVPNPGEYHVSSRDGKTPIQSPTANLEVNNGQLEIPTAPGLGVEIDPDFKAKHRVMS